ncbi:MAG: hypothetical protein LC791_16160 [Acidobacteria bacterium]|nr:hypothetical protein [Acidobacteriota bacterium]
MVYNITGSNPRVNVNSTDHSTNVVNVSADDLFDKLRRALGAGVADESKRNELLERAMALHDAVHQSSYVARYQEFIASAADHMTLLSPFIPAPGQFFGP